MMASAKTVLGEVVQLVPVITLASSFIVSGGVDLERAAPLFVASAIIAVIITGVLMKQKVLLNPILVGTNLWLCLGALAFGIPIPPFADIIGSLQAVGLYVCTLGVGVVYAAVKPTGYIGMRHPDPRVVRRLSLIMVGLTVTALIWSFLFIHNIRLGGGLPFIVLNVTRRIMIRRAR
jgi:hypothetical protein